MKMHIFNHQINKNIQIFKIIIVNYQYLEMVVHVNYGDNSSSIYIGENIGDPDNMQSMNDMIKYKIVQKHGSGKKALMLICMMKMVENITINGLI